MPMLEIGPDDALFYEWTAPTTAGAPSFIFVNPIVGDTSLWNAAIVPALTSAGFGALVYDFRGQSQSRFKPGINLDADIITGDLVCIVEHVQPEKPVLVGLSIGGLYSARAILDGLKVSGLVLINTLRRMTPRVQWMNDATMRAMQVGGPNLMKDLYFHLLVGEDFQAANRSAFLADDPDYTPLNPKSGAYNLVEWMGQTSWDIDWSKLTPPTLVLTGLQDRVFFDAKNVGDLFTTLPNGKREDFAEAGHMLPVETPKRFIEALKAFGAEISAG
jgi:3-oxoadipate enol-lactonase